MDSALAGYIVEEYISLYAIYRQVVWEILQEGGNPIPITDFIDYCEMSELP